MIKEFETQRLIIRTFKDEDYKDIFDNYASNDNVTKFLTWPTHKSYEDSKAFIEFVKMTYKTSNPFQWALVLKESNQVIGNIAVVLFDEKTKSAELGWVLSEKYWGQGMMKEAGECVIKYLFEDIDVNRIWAMHDVNNPKSGKVMEKLGMKAEGVLRASQRNNQGIADMKIYSILKREYKE